MSTKIHCVALVTPNQLESSKPSQLYLSNKLPLLLQFISTVITIEVEAIIIIIIG